MLQHAICFANLLHMSECQVTWCFYTATVCAEVLSFVLRRCKWVWVWLRPNNVPFSVLFGLLCFREHPPLGYCLTSGYVPSVQCSLSLHLPPLAALLPNWWPPPNLSQLIIWPSSAVCSSQKGSCVLSNMTLVFLLGFLVKFANKEIYVKPAWLMSTCRSHSCHIKVCTVGNHNFPTVLLRADTDRQFIFSFFCIWMHRFLSSLTKDGRPDVFLVDRKKHIIHITDPQPQTTLFFTFSS